MKQIFLFLMFGVLGLLVVSSHEVNKYKYFCMDVDENPYGIEKRFIKEFQKLGFTIINHDSYDEFDAKEKALTLIADYNYFINYNGPSSLSLELRNAADVTIWTATGYGNTLLSATGDMKGATKQILRAFAKLRYKFNGPIIGSTTKHPYSMWEEDSIKSYLRTNKLYPIEGIYKNYSNQGNSYDIAVIKHDDKYIGFIIKSDNEFWSNGETKLVLNHIENNIYDVEYYDATHQKINAIASIDDNRLLNFSASYNGDIVDFSFLKVFPPKGDETSSVTPAPISTGKCRGTGSGVLISDNIIITNLLVELK